MRRQNPPLRCSQCTDGFQAGNVSIEPVLHHVAFASLDVFYHVLPPCTPPHTEGAEKGKAQALALGMSKLESLVASRGLGPVTNLAPSLGLCVQGDKMKLTLRDCGGTEAEMLPGEQAGGRTVGARELRLLRLTLSPPGTAGRAGAECDYPRWNEASVSHDTLLSVRSGN